MLTPSLLLLLAVLRVTLALPAAEPSTPSKKCLTTGCTVEESPIWDPIQQKCVCKWTFSPPPPNAQDEKTICIAATECPPHTSPIWDAVARTCSCQPIAKREVDPTTCPTIRCAGETIPVYHPELNHCTCDDACAGTTCIAEKRSVFNRTSKGCACDWIPGLEPASSETCADTFCISEMEPVFNSTSGQCECQWLPGFGPGLGPVRRTAVGGECDEVFCIAEQQPVFNATDGQCECEWIPGLGPVEERTAVGSCRGVFCIAEQHPVYNATLGRCVCEWIPGLGPVTVDERQVEKRSALPN